MKKKLKEAPKGAQNFSTKLQNCKPIILKHEEHLTVILGFAGLSKKDPSSIEFIDSVVRYLSWTIAGGNILEKLRSPVEVQRQEARAVSTLAKSLLGKLNGLSNENKFYLFSKGFDRGIFSDLVHQLNLDFDTKVSFPIHQVEGTHWIKWNKNETWQYDDFFLITRLLSDLSLHLESRSKMLARPQSNPKNRQQLKEDIKEELFRAFLSFHALDDLVAEEIAIQMAKCASYVFSVLGLGEYKIGETDKGKEYWGRLPKEALEFQSRPNLNLDAFDPWSKA